MLKSSPLATTHFALPTLHLHSSVLGQIQTRVNMGDTNMLLNASYVVLFGIWLASGFVVIDMTASVIIQATLIILIGSYRSLSLLATAEERDGVEKEVMSSKDAAQFPIVGSVALFGLFLAFKYLDREMVK